MTTRAMTKRTGMSCLTRGHQDVLSAAAAAVSEASTSAARPGFSSMSSILSRTWSPAFVIMAECSISSTSKMNDKDIAPRMVSKMPEESISSSVPSSSTKWTKASFGMKTTRKVMNFHMQGIPAIRYLTLPSLMTIHSLSPGLLGSHQSIINIRRQTWISWFTESTKRNKQSQRHPRFSRPYSPGSTLSLMTSSWSGTTSNSACLMNFCTAHCV
mmetsp:Transcript_8054/g.18837  ORF Transcript_8054/g.18837 Transcript_8054/m.18837 type:complete len:214 (+) Transcript_8054:350-991(+)